MPSDYHRADCESRGYVNDYLQESAPEERAETLLTIVEFCRWLRERHPEPTEPPEDVLSALSEYRPAWSAWAALINKWRTLRGITEADKWMPFASHRPAPDWPLMSTPYMERPWGVVMEFDGRTSRRGVHQFIDAMWPHWEAANMVSPRRPLTERGSAMIRLVCIDLPPDITWRERHTAWNERYPQWEIRDVQNFHKEFRRLEEQLVDQAGGLDWAYDSEVLEFGSMKLAEIQDLERQGGKKWRRYLRWSKDFYHRRYGRDKGKQEAQNGEA